MSRRSLLAVTGWLLAAVAATVAGLAAVRVIGVNLTGPVAEVVSEDEVGGVAAGLSPWPAGPSASPSPSPGRSASPGAVPTGSPAPSGAPATAPGGTTGESAAWSTRGGLVMARCDGDRAVLLSWAPAQGYRTDRADREPDDHVRVRFEGTAGRVEVDVRCAAGRPIFSTREDH